MARKTIVTLPDGTVASRTSQSRVYSHAVVAKFDERAHAAALRAKADEIDAYTARAREIIASGDLARFTRQATSFNGRGERFYSSFVPGYTRDTAPAVHLPDYRDVESWTRYAESGLAHSEELAAKNRREAADLDAGPAATYAVYRWSSRADLAAKALDEHRLAWETRTVVECHEAPAGRAK